MDINHNHRCSLPPGGERFSTLIAVLNVRDNFHCERCKHCHYEVQRKNRRGRCCNLCSIRGKYRLGPAHNVFFGSSSESKENFRRLGIHKRKSNPRLHRWLPTLYCLTAALCSRYTARTTKTTGSSSGTLRCIHCCTE